MARTLNIFGRTFTLPRNKSARIALGSALLLGGTLGFLPVVGFWMIPLGLMVLGQDIPAVRRFHRRMTVRFGRWRQRRAAKADEDLARRGARA